MEKIELPLINQLGLHARASSQLIKTASRFASSITINYSNRQADAKSIMDVMMLGASCGSNLIITAQGEDEKQALQAISELIQNKFGEEQ